MHDRERIPKTIVEKYQDTIVFMVDIDQCLMETIEPSTIWIMPMGYEVDEKILEPHAQHLLRKLVDPLQERFGTYVEKSLKLHKKLKKP